MDTLSNRRSSQQSGGWGLRKSTVLGVALAFLLFFAGKGQIVYAASITVTTTEDELNADGDCSLREALQSANTDTAVDACFAGSGPDTITLPAGTYILSIAGAGEDANATGDFDVTTDVTIQGAGAATTIIDGAALDGVLTVHGGQVQILGVTIRNGANPGFGGIANGGNLTLTAVTVEGNHAENGAGIRNNGTLAIYNSTITGNSATFKGGGILNGPTGSITINNSTISENSALEAGGINNGDNGEGTLLIIDSILSGNVVTGLGGAITNAGLLTVEGSTFSDNSAENGAGIFNRGSMSVTGSSFSGNTATCCGGAVSVASGVAIIENSTFSENTAADGGAIINGGDLDLTDVTMINNTAGYGGGAFNSGTLSVTHSTIRENSATQGGGGIHNREGGVVTVDASMIKGNSAWSGGGIDNSVGPTPGTVRIKASQVIGNMAYLGGGIYNETGMVTVDGGGMNYNTASVGGGIFNRDLLFLTNSVVTGNSATAGLGSGGGIFNVGGSVTLTKSKVRGNRPDNCVGC